MVTARRIKTPESPIEVRTPPPRTRMPLVFAALACVQFLFGFNYIASKVVVHAFPPLLWASIRCSSAAVLLCLLAVFFKRPHPPLKKEFFGPLVLLSLLSVTLNQGFFLMGLYYTTPTNSAVLNTLIPLFALALITLRGQEKMTERRAVGFACSLAGVLLLDGIEHFTLSNHTAVGDCFTILNCLSYACFLAFGKKFVTKYDSIWTTAWFFICGAIGLGLLSLPSWRTFHWPTLTMTAKLCALYTILGATLLSYLLNMWALSKAEASQVAIFIYIQPVVAALLSVLFLGSHLSARTLVASAFIFVGVYLALIKKENGPRPIRPRAL